MEPGSFGAFPGGVADGMHSVPGYAFTADPASTYVRLGWATSGSSDLAAPGRSLPDMIATKSEVAAGHLKLGGNAYAGGNRGAPSATGGTVHRVEVWTVIPNAPMAGTPTANWTPSTPIVANGSSLILPPFVLDAMLYGTHVLLFFDSLDRHVGSGWFHLLPDDPDRVPFPSIDRGDAMQITGPLGFMPRIELMWNPGGGDVLKPATFTRSSVEANIAAGWLSDSPHHLSTAVLDFSFQHYDPGNTDGVAECVADILGYMSTEHDWPATRIVFEGPNENDRSGGALHLSVPAAKTFFETLIGEILAGYDLAGVPRSQARIGLPSVLSPMNGLPLFDAVFDASTIIQDLGANGQLVATQHLYNATASLAESHRSQAGAEALYAKWGVVIKFCTESPSAQIQPDGASGLCTPWRQLGDYNRAIHVIMYYGGRMDAIHFYHPYDLVDGFRGWLVNSFGIAGPALDYLLTLRRVLRGCSPVREDTVPCGVLDTRTVSAMVFVNPDDDTRVVDVFTACASGRDIKLQISKSGGLPSSGYSAEDFAGNPLTCTKSGNVLTVHGTGERDGFSRFIHLPAGVIPVEVLDVFDGAIPRSSFAGTTAIGSWAHGIIGGLGAQPVTKALTGPLMSATRDADETGAFDSLPASLGVASEGDPRKARWFLPSKRWMNWAAIGDSPESWEELSVWTKAELWVKGAGDVLQRVWAFERQPDYLVRVMDWQSGPPSYVQWLNAQPTNHVFRFTLDADGVTPVRVRTDYIELRVFGTTAGKAPNNTTDVTTARGLTNVLGETVDVWSVEAIPHAYVYDFVFGDDTATPPPVVPTGRRYLVRQA